MPSFEINPNAKKGSERDKKLQNRADAGGVEGRTAAKMMQKKGKGPSLPGRSQDMKKVSEEEVVPGIKLVDVILGEEKCGKGMYYCYTDKKCKKMPEGLKMTARFGGGGHEPQEVGIDKPVEGGEGGNGGNGGGTSESVSIEDAFGNKFMEVVDLIKPEDIVEKCWKGYKKKGMKTMFGKRYPNCVKANEENKLTDDAKEEVNVDEGVRLPSEYGNLLAVVVIWRGKSLMIKMFFPQAKMPTRAEIQTEIEKVYPGGKVTSFTRTDLPSSYAPTNSPLLKVQKEEAECAGTPKGEDCAVHGQKCCPNLSEEEVDEAAGEKDACYHKVKSRYSVWPSAYASGALVKCRKKGAKNWGNKTKKEEFEFSDWRSRLGKIDEKLNIKKAGMGEVIDDFYDSDAPQFKGKSKEKRRQMAIAAKLQADEERACWKTHKKVGMKMKGGKLVNDCRPKNEDIAVDENRFASHGGKDSDAGSAYAKPSKGGNKKGVYTLKGKDGKPLFDKNEAVDLKKKSSERKLNTNPGEKPESAKEYRKNSEPLRKHREKFGDLAKEEKEGDHEFEMARRQLSTMKNAAKKLEKKMGKKGEGNLKAWVQSKITKAADYADTAADYVTKEDWQSVNRKDKTDGLSQKAVNAYRKENPGSKLKTAVTKKPSQLKKGSKDAKRRSSFCSRMKGMKKRLTSAKTARDPDSRINKALRRWNCN